MTGDGQCIGILGMSYKPDTDVIEESQGLMLAKVLVAAGCRVAVYDPAALENARQALPASVLIAPSMEACAAEADVLVIATPWNQFKALRPEHLRSVSGRRTIIMDWWRLLPPSDFDAVADYIACGQGSTLAHAERPRSAATGHFR